MSIVMFEYAKEEDQKKLAEPGEEFFGVNPEHVICVEPDPVQRIMCDTPVTKITIIKQEPTMGGLHYQEFKVLGKVADVIDRLSRASQSFPGSAAYELHKLRGKSMVHELQKARTKSKTKPTLVE